MAGIKWIASFPDNIKKGIPRAHSVVILNNADTGEPVAIICTPLLSIIRTASVSGLVVKYFQRRRNLRKVNVGIAGFGPIGQYHLKMCSRILADRLAKVSIFDLRTVDPGDAGHNVNVVSTWEEAYRDADIFITCTVSDSPYIDQKPKPGSLHLNVSLRDYKTNVYQWFRNSIIVDDWEEVCRERTDIEMMHREMGLEREHTKSIVDIVAGKCLDNAGSDAPVMFNPMGMAVFDIAMGNYYYKKCLATEIEVVDQVAGFRGK